MAAGGGHGGLRKGETCWSNLLCRVLSTLTQARSSGDSAHCLSAAQRLTTNLLPTCETNVNYSRLLLMTHSAGSCGSAWQLRFQMSRAREHDCGWAEKLPHLTSASSCARSARTRSTSGLTEGSGL